MVLNKTCNTISGPIGWNTHWKCQFPFWYNGKEYKECVETKVKRGYHETTFSWCSTKVFRNNKSHINGNWGECPKDCDCTTMGGPESFWNPNTKCQFPFMYSGKEYNGCIQYEIEGGEKGLWCSTKVHTN